jgi:hypothetical protein
MICRVDAGAGGTWRKSFRLYIIGRVDAGRLWGMDC